MKRISRSMTKILVIAPILMLSVLLYACVQGNSPAESLPVSSNSEASQMELPAQPEERTALFGSFGGTIKEIAPFYESDDKTERPGWYFVLTLSPDGQEGTIAITDKTFFATDSKLAMGSSIICFYDMTAPMPAINPPRYNAEVVAIDFPNDQAIKVDRFDNDLISSDNMLKLNIADTTEIISRDGEPFDGSLAGRDLVVYYTFSTRSIPAQTTPDKIVVLS